MSMYNPNQIYHQLMEAGEDWADKKSAYELLNDMTKSVLAQEMAKLDGSNADRKTKAEASQEYKNHLKTLAESRKAFLLSQVKYDSIKALSDHRRTEQSTRRVEMQHISGT